MSFDLKKTKTFSPVEMVKMETEFSRDVSEEQEIVRKSSSDSVSWQAPEFEVYEKSRLWYSATTLVLLAIVAYALWNNSPIMAITFILVGVVGYLHLQKDPEVLDFVINHSGVQAGRELYEFDNIESFWIFYDPPHTKTLSLHTKASFMPFVHIPLENEDPVIVREFLMKFIEEEKQEAGFVDALERFLHF